MFADPGDCTDGDVRLNGGTIELQGRPEVCINGVWGSICDSGWTLVDAHAFCTELGHPGTGKVTACVHNSFIYYYRSYYILLLRVW